MTMGTSPALNRSHVSASPMGAVPRRLAALTSLLAMAVYMIWKIRQDHVVAQSMRIAYSKQKEDSSFVEQSSVGDEEELYRDPYRRRLRVNPMHVAMARRRTKVNTFYAPILTNADSPREQKTFAADQALLQQWKRAWYQAGWEPVVLTLEHAKQHPQFDSYMHRLANNISLLGKGGRNEEYNRYCFLRFLAMAASGGGLLSDYDMMPLKSTRWINPRGGSNGVLPTAPFTIYQKTLNNAGGIPSLAAGSAIEWQRMADLIWTVAESRPNDENAGWSDMLAVMVAGREDNGAYQLQNEVVGYHELILREKEKDSICTEKWAVHFSHYDVQSEGYKALDRPQILQEFLDRYRKSCSDTPLPSSR